MKHFINLIALFFIILTFTSCGGEKADKLPSFKEMEPYSYNDDDSFYEDGEDNSTARWQVWQGHPVKNVADGANGSKRSIFVRENWLIDGESNVTDRYVMGKAFNDAHYELPINNSKQFILEFDKKKRGGILNHCFSVGVKVDTVQGERYITFNTHYDLIGMRADKQLLMDGTILEMVFPLSMEYVDEFNVWKHLRLDLNEYLREFEPTNKITTVKSFYFQGGDDYLDNIRLVSK